MVLSEKFAALGWNESGSTAQTILSSVSRREFTGQEGLDNAGLWMVNMNGRVYLPSGSMFLSPDPNIPDPTNTVDYNRYACADFNPLTYNDPTGFASCDAKCKQDKKNLTDSSSGSGGTSSSGGGFGPGGSFGKGSDGGMYAGFSGATCDGNCWVSVDDWDYQTITDYNTGKNSTALCYHGKDWYLVPSIGGGLQGGTIFGVDGQSFGSGFGRLNFTGIGGAAGPSKPGTMGPVNSPQQQSSTKTLPPCSSIAGASGNFTSQIGVQASGGFHFDLFGLNVGLDLGMNLLSYNTPLSGSPYISHGLDAEITIGSARFGGSWEQTSYNGGLNYESEPNNFLLYDFSGSSQGLDYQFTPPQLFAGFKAGISNVAALLPAGDTPQCRR